MFVDFTAAWCVTCQINKRMTLATAALCRRSAQRHVVLLRADWTRRDPAITEALRPLGRSGVPVYALYAPGRANRSCLSEILTVSEVRDAIARWPGDRPFRHRGQSAPSTLTDKEPCDEESLDPCAARSPLALLCATGAAAQAVIGQPAPAFTAVDATGKTVSLADFKGKHVVLEWVNPGCPYVQKHYNSGNMPATQKAAIAKGVVWLA